MIRISSLTLKLSFPPHYLSANISMRQKQIDFLISYLYCLRLYVDDKAHTTMP